MTGDGRATPPITTPHHSSAFTTLHDRPSACGRPGRQAIGPLANDPDIAELAGLERRPRRGLSAWSAEHTGGVHDTSRTSLWTMRIQRELCPNRLAGDRRADLFRTRVSRPGRERSRDTAVQPPAPVGNVARRSPARGDRPSCVRARVCHSRPGAAGGAVGRRGRARSRSAHHPHRPRSRGERRP